MPDKPHLMRSTLLVLVLLPALAFAQLSKYERSYSDTLPEKFVISSDKLREHIFAGIPAAVRNGEYSRRALNFSHSSAIQISDYVASGVVYSDWDELESYLNNILKKVLPAELAGDSVIHAYVVRDGSYNAFMTPSGQMFVHIGLIDESENEASIAGVLAHELAHYYLRHSLNSFMEEEAGNFDRGIIKTGKARSKYSVNSESQADSLAANWMKNSGYSLEGLLSSFQTMYRLERNNLKKARDEWESKERSHPMSSKRLSRLMEYYQQNPVQGSNFLVDEAYFNRLREEVKPEILKSLLNNFAYSACIESSFRYHIFDPDNNTYVYYLLEGIRRHCYMNNEHWKELFITNMYYDSVMVDGKRHKEKMTNHLFKKFDLDIIPIRPKDGVKIKARFYWRDQPKFTTYEEAYNFFYKVSQALNCHECVLSNALSYTKDSIARNKLLITYLGFEDIKHREYAEKLLSRSFDKDLPDHKIIVFNDPYAWIEQGYEKIPLTSKKAVFAEVMDSVLKGQSLRTGIYMPEFKKYHMNDYRDFSALQDFSIEIIVSKGEKTELHILDPRYWEMFHKYKVNEIEFVHSAYNEVFGKDKTIEAYRKIINNGYEPLFGMRDHTKYYDVYLSSVREIPNSLMKLGVHDGDSKLEAKEQNKVQMARILKKDLALKDARAIEADNRYRYRNK
jgi:Zn-dependent protease with chaperone function